MIDHPNSTTRRCRPGKWLPLNELDETVQTVTVETRDMETTRLRDMEETERDCILGETTIEGPRCPRRARVGVTFGIG